MPKISVIIPVYNTEKYLERCLTSVVNQTLNDIEIICINDCSTDGSLSFLKEHALKDKRIKLIDLPQNSGAANARNKGIETAMGEYLAFLDSDDYIDTDFYEKLYKKAKENNSDIVKGSYKYSGTGYVDVYINEKIKENKNNFCSTYCSAIFKASLIKDNYIKFPDIRDMEDPVFTFTASLRAKDVQVLDNLYVHINERIDSVTKSYLTQSRLKDKIAGMEMIIELANNSDIDEDCYANVTSVWFGNLFSGFEKLDIDLKLIIASETKRLYGKIIHKKHFCSVLEKYDSFLSYLLKNRKFKNIAFYSELKQIKEQSAQIKELKQANSVYENCYSDMVNKYAEKVLKNIKAEDIYFICVVNNYETYNRCIKENPFVCAPPNIKIFDFDNTKENIPIPQRYNEFLNTYDYANDAWFVFCHCDWELMDDINRVLSKLNKDFLYGPIGSKLKIVEQEGFRILTGCCYERRRDGSGLRLLGNISDGLELSDTFDCQALIVHSSLIKKIGLRFDENLLWDLYVEDFCIQAKVKFNINSYTVNLKCCHWSGYHLVPDTYRNSLNYINTKYPDGSYGGTVSIIGGVKLNDISFERDIFQKLRQNVIADLKKDKYAKNIRSNTCL